MAQKTTLRTKGLVTDPNRLSSLPEGSLLTGTNIIIDRDNVIESRRGFSEYGNTFGTPDSRAKQLLTYKNRILLHYEDKLLFNSNEHNLTVDGDFQAFDGIYEELESGLRIRSVESNKNLFFTTNDGIKKISAKTANDFTTTPNFIQDAGAIKALDVTGTLNSTTEGFLPPNSEVAYRIVWSYKDANNNLIVGSPSSRLVISNFSTSNANVDLQFVIPENINSSYFYQVYRSAVFTATGNLTLDDIDPGDELQLVIEDFPTTDELTANLVEVTDLSPEDFRAGGLPLYTNPTSGDGIASANEPPPKAKDVTMYQSTVFYANTETRARTVISLLGVNDLISGVSTVTIDDGINPSQTYTFVGEKEITTIDFNSYSVGFPSALEELDGKYFLINSASDKRKYYVWYDNTKTKQIIDFTNYTVSTIPDDLKEKFFLLHTKDADRKYYVWYDSTGSDIDPGTNPDNGLLGFIGIKIDISSGVLTEQDVANATALQIALVDDASENDFDVNYATGSGVAAVTFGSPTVLNTVAHGLETGDYITISGSDTTPSIDGTHYITKIDNDNFSIDVTTSAGTTANWQANDAVVIVYSESFDDSQYTIVENIFNGFLFQFDTPTNNDPSNNLDINGRISFRVNISRNVSSLAELASITASSINDQDLALDFEIDYTDTDTFLIITTSNNGETTDATDAAFGSDIGATVTFGTPTSINSVAHGLKTGDYITITNSTTTPNIDGSYNITKIDNDNFTIDFTTTVGGTCDWSADSGIGNGFSITINQQGDGEDASLNQVLLSAALSPAQQIDETARSLVNIINKNTLESVYAFYISGPTDLPGQILLEVRDIGINQFTVTADSAETGGSFNPSLPPYPNATEVKGETEIKPNRVYFAKLQQPEAVPSLNFIDVGPEDKAISRILALRESLFILKEDGVYRLTGLDGNYAVDLFDESTKIIAPDSAVVLNNQIYCLTNLGIAAISDTGVSLISDAVDSDIKVLTSSNYNFKNTSFGVSYETDFAYLLWLPSSVTDTVATTVYRYSTKTNTFTTFELSKICGLVNPGDDKLYLGTADTNYIERERKIFDRTDYADRDFELTIPTDSVDGTSLKLSSSLDVSIGDALVQTQYVTIGQYNQLLQKLDLDPSIGEAEVTRFDFTSYTGTIPNDLHSKYFILYAASDSEQYVVFFDAQGDLPELDTDVFNDIIDAEQIRVDISSGILTLAQLTEATKTAIQSATFDFVVSYISGNTFFDITTVRNGNTTDALDSAVNGVSNGFLITVLTQGIGDFFDTLEMSQGDNILNKLNDLATKLDNDPGIVQNDFASAIATYMATGSSVTAGNPTVITEVAHGLQDGRIVTISNSTTTPNIDGTYEITKIDDDNFSINVVTTVSGVCDWLASLTSFLDAQGAFNTIVKKLNNDTGVSYQNYNESEGTREYEVLVIDKELNTTDVIMQFSMPYMEGPIQVYEGITCNIQYSPETFGDTSLMKQVQEATVIFENTNFSRATVGFKTDLSPGFEEIDFLKTGKGDFGYFIFSEHNWGGGFSGVPLRTYIPRQKQRCRYIQIAFTHNSARERFLLYGFSYTFRPVSERAYRS